MRKLALVVMIVFFPMLSQAQERRNHFDRHYDDSFFWHKVDDQLYQQSGDIDIGIETDELTRREVKKLHREQQHVSKQLRHYRRHDYLSHADKKDITRHLNYMSDKIWRLRRNGHYAHTHARHRDYSNRNTFVLKNNKHRKNSVGFHLSF